MAPPYDVPPAFPMQPLPVNALRSPVGNQYLPPVPPQPAMGAPAPQTPDMSQVSTDQLSPFGHMGDTLNQLIANKTQQQNGGGLLSQILAQRFQPTFADANEAGLREAQSYASKGGFQAFSPQDIANEHLQNQLTPYTSMLGLQGQQADVTLKQAQANQANAMSQFFAGTATPFGGNGQPSGQPAANGQPMTTPGGGKVTFNPRGAMIAKMMGLPEGMQIGSSGQPEQIPGMATAGQKEQDTNFAQAWQTYSNTGGAARTQNAIQTVDDVINQLKSGKLKTGGMGAAFAMHNGEPTDIGKMFNRDLLVARTRISNAILPQAKALFGARVTNFDAQSLINSQGLDPMADTGMNIQKLEMLKNSLIAGQQDLQTSGQYFQQHGTLAGYQPSIMQQPSSPNATTGASINPPSVGTATHRYNPATGQIEAVQ